MNERFQTLVYGAVLALIVGWVLYIGKDVFIPIVFGILVVYVIVGLTRLLGKVPFFDRILPLQVRYSLSILLIALGLVEVAYLVITNVDEVVALGPKYQESLLSTIQKVAILFHMETDLTWTTLRQEILARTNMQRLIGSILAYVFSIVVSILVMVLYASFLLIEQRSFSTKIDNLSSDPRNIARIREVTTDINARIGSYLALKTFIGILLGAISWMVMAYVGLEFAALWAILIVLLNYVPYIGSFLGVLFPVIMAIMQFFNLNEVLAVLLPLTIVQFLIGNFLDPYVMGNSLNLSPFVILVSLTVWSGLWGIPGAFLAVPITAIMAIVFSEFAGTRPLAVLLSRNGQL
jgi:AI-2 transport protein TqsA